MKTSAQVKTMEFVTLVMSKQEAEVVNKLTRQVAGRGKYRDAADSLSAALEEAGIANLRDVPLQFNVHSGFGGSVRFAGE